MPDLDLEPKDYRADPIKGEPVIAPGGLRRLAIYGAVLATVLIVGAAFRPVAHWVADATWPFIWPQ